MDPRLSYMYGNSSVAEGRAVHFEFAVVRSVRVTSVDLSSPDDKWVDRACCDERVSRSA